MASRFGPRPPPLRESLPAAPVETPPTLSYLPGPWLRPTLAQRTSSPHNRGAWAPGQPLPDSGGKSRLPLASGEWGKSRGGYAPPTIY